MITTHTKIKVIVVEDEAILAQDICYRLEHCNCEVVGVASSAEEALTLLKNNHNVDILLIDIYIHGDKDGIALAQIINQEYSLPFIFLSAHADKATIERAKKVQPNAYLLKPFNDLQVQVAIEMALVDFSKHSKSLEKLGAKQNENENENENENVLHIKNSLFLKKNQHFERVPIEDILYLEADNNYCSVHTAKGTYVYSVVLKKMEEQLPLQKFIRVHRSYIVNIDAVNGFQGNLLYLGDQQIPVSKSHRTEVFRLFKTI